MNTTLSWRKLALAAVLALPAFCAAPALGAGDVVISQVWGGGDAASSGQPNADYVELFNRTANPIDMSAWSLQVASPTSTSWGKLDLGGTIQPYSYYLVRVSFTPSGPPNFIADETFTPTTNRLQIDGGKVALRNNQFTLDISVDPDHGVAGCPVGDSSIIDFVGYGSGADCREGASAADNAIANTTGLTPTRNSAGCVDTDNNKIDFSLIAPSPRNSFSPAQTSCGATGACCDPLTATCTIDSSASCIALGRSYIGNAILCTSSPCPALGKCCVAASGFCYTITQVGCQGVSTGVWTSGQTCPPSSPCGASTGACCFPDGTCCAVAAQFSCTTLGGTPMGSSCTPVVGTMLGFACATQPPANDLCTGAIPLTLGVPRTGQSYTALANEYSNNLCNYASGNNHGVWFTFTPAVSAQYDLSACGTRFDADLQIFTIANCAQPTTWSYVACDQDMCLGTFPETGPCGVTGLFAAPRISGVRLLAGQTYHIMLTSSGSAGSGGNYVLTMTTSPDTLFGACCNNDTGQCEMRSPAGCASSVPPATYQGDGTTCATINCGTMVGACCAATGSCTLRTIAICPIAWYKGDGTVCLPTPCQVGACCSATTGFCSILQSASCAAGNYQGDGSTCSPSTCLKGTCCDASNACTFVIQSQCQPGSIWTLGGACMASGQCAPSTVTCCRGTTCLSVAAGSCTGVVAGSVSTIINAPSTCTGTSIPSCCYADYDHNGTKSIDDIFTYLNAWFARSPYAKVGGDGTATPIIDDIFAFLNYWFAGCH